MAKTYVNTTAETERWIRTTLSKWMVELDEDGVPVEQWQAEFDEVLDDWSAQGLELPPGKIDVLRKWVWQCQAEAVPDDWESLPAPTQLTAGLPTASEYFFESLTRSDRLIVDENGNVFWEARPLSAENRKMHIGQLDGGDPSSVMVLARFSPGLVRLRDLYEAVHMVNLPRRATTSPGDNFFDMRDFLVDLQRQEATRREEQRRLDEAARRLQENQDKIRRYMAPRMELRPDGSVRILGDIDNTVRLELRRNNQAGPIFRPGVGGRPEQFASESEALHGTNEEYFQALRAELRRLIQEEQAANRSFLDKTLDGVQLVLDLIGQVPAFGAPADFGSGVISWFRGDYVGAGLAFTAMVVDAAGVAKVLRRLAKVLEAAKFSPELVKRVRHTAEVLSNEEYLRQAGISVLRAVDEGTLTRDAAIRSIREMQPGLSPNEASALFDWTLIVARAGEESGLPMVFRKDMPLNLVTDKQGRQVPIWGGSNSSSKTTGHAETIDRKARELASTGDYANLFIGDRSWRTATGRVANSRLRPDIIAVGKTGRCPLLKLQRRWIEPRSYCNSA